MIKSAHTVTAQAFQILLSSSSQEVTTITLTARAVLDQIQEQGIQISSVNMIFKQETKTKQIA
jgi:hypothetical protein